MKWLNAKLTSLLPLPYADNLMERRTEKLVRLTFSNRVLSNHKISKTSFARYHRSTFKTVSPC